MGTKHWPPKHNKSRMAGALWSKHILKLSLLVYFVSSLTLNLIRLGVVSHVAEAWSVNARPLHKLHESGFTRCAATIPEPPNNQRHSAPGVCTSKWPAPVRFSKQRSQNTLQVQYGLGNSSANSRLQVRLILRITSSAAVGSTGMVYQTRSRTWYSSKSW